MGCPEGLWSLLLEDLAKSPGHGPDSNDQRQDDCTVGHCFLKVLAAQIDPDDYNRHI